MRSQKDKLKTIEVRHIEDARYLHYCGLFVRNYRDGLVDIHPEHEEQGKAIMEWKPRADAKFRRR